MTWRSVAAYYAIAAVLGGYISVIRTSRTPVVDDAQTVNVPIVEALSARLDAVVLEAAGLRTRLRRGENDRWTVVEPAGVKLTSDLIEALLDTLTTIPPIEMLEAETEGDKVKFGLAPAEIRLRIGSRDELVANVGVGRRNPTRTAVYASREGIDGVFLIGLNARYYVELIVDELKAQLDPSPGA